MTNISKSSNDLIGESEGIIRSTSVVIRTIDHTYIGHIIHFNNERLLDVLNNGSVGDQPDLTVDFLRLHNMQIHSPDGQIDTTFPNSIIAKNGIVFVGEEICSEIKIPCLHWNRLTNVITKKSICVEIHMPSLIITGKIYIEPWQRLIAILNDKRRFLPITGAVISFKQKAAITKFEFVAVNRNHINCITKIEEPKQGFYLS